MAGPTQANQTPEADSTFRLALRQRRAPMFPIDQTWEETWMPPLPNSVYVDVSTLDWQPTQFPGIMMKLLMTYRSLPQYPTRHCIAEFDDCERRL